MRVRSLRPIESLAVAMLAGALVGDPLWAQNLPDTRRQPPAETRRPVPTVPETPPPTLGGEDIVRELRELVKAVEAMREQQKAQVAVAYLQAQQSRLLMVENQLAQVRSQIAVLKQQQAVNSRRLENLQMELTMRNILDRNTGEQLIRSEVQAEDERIQRELPPLETRLAALEQEYTQIKTSLDAINAQVLEFIKPEKPATDQPVP